MKSAAAYASAVQYSEDLYLVPSKVTILITVPWSELKKEEKDQLSKITEALRQRINPKLNLYAFEIVEVPFLDLSSWPKKPEKLIYFGPPVKGIAMYELIEAPDTKMVLSEPLSELLSNDGSRSKLWLALQQLFAK